MREKGGQELVIIFKTTTMSARQAAGALFVSDMQAIGIQVNPEYSYAGIFFGTDGPLETRDFDIAEFTTGYCLNAEDTTCVSYPMFLVGDQGIS